MEFKETNKSKHGKKNDWARQASGNRLTRSPLFFRPLFIFVYCLSSRSNYSHALYAHIYRSINFVQQMSTQVTTRQQRCVFWVGEYICLAKPISWNYAMRKSTLKLKNHNEISFLPLIILDELQSI